MVDWANLTGLGFGLRLGLVTFCIVHSDPQIHYFFEKTVSYKLPSNICSCGQPCVRW